MIRCVIRFPSFPPVFHGRCPCGRPSPVSTP